MQSRYRSQLRPGFFGARIFFIDCKEDFMKIFSGKRFCKIASVFAAILFAFSFLSCSDGSDSGSTLAQDGNLSSMTSREFAAAMTVG